MNFICLMFSLLSTTMILVGSIINLAEKRLPAFFLRIFQYGKFAYSGKVSGIGAKVIIEVPKSWFKHFYWIAIITYTMILYQTTSLYIFKNNVPGWMITFLNIVCGSNRTAYVSAINVYIALLLMTLQVYRRFHDTNVISVFGKNSRMNISHYLVGIIHYPGAALAILCESPGFAKKSSYATTDLDISSLSYMELVAILIFIWAWWHQYKTTIILANLRKDKKGNIITDEHKLPQGDWFNYLSAPHQIAEILMYFAITILLWYNITWFFVFIWVLCNQVETILLTHWWYQETFEKFPKTRKALIPYLY